MPNWKKVVVSGSAANLSSLSVDTYISASQFIGGHFTGSLFATASQGKTAAVIAGQATITGNTSDAAGNRNTLYLKNTNSTGNQSNAIILGSEATASAWFVGNDLAADGTTVDDLSFLHVPTNTEVLHLGLQGSTFIGGVTADSFTGSLEGTASQAISASYSDFANTASFALNFNPDATASYALQALTASYALNAGSGGGVTTGSNVFEGDQTISGSLTVTGSTSANIFLYPQTASNVVVPAGYNGLLVTPVQLIGSSSVEIGGVLVIL